LSEDPPDGGGEEEVLNPHVDKSCDGTGCVVGMESRKHEMSCEGRLYCDLGGFQISNLPDHDDIRILSHDVPQGIGEIESYLGLTCI